MVTPRTLFWSAGALLGASLCTLATGCKLREKDLPIVVDSPARVAARSAWRAEQDHTMRSELSPLSRIDYVHLPVGDHVIKAATPPFNFPAAALAPDPGEVRLRVEPNRLALAAAPPVSVNGNPIAAADFKKHDLLALGRLRLLISEIGADAAIAVYDPEAPERRAYSGLHYYPDQGGYVTMARLERYAAPRTVRVAASRGEDREMQAVGILRFTLAGNSASMEAYAEQPGSKCLFLIFHDTTCEKSGSSYGAGRYLYATVDSDDKVPLDFNQAWNPLCAYSSYFHCPMPPRSNWFAFAVPVGEMKYRPDH